MDSKIIRDLECKAKEIRYLILKTTHEAGAGHTGGSLSMTEIMTALFFNIMNIDSSNPTMEGRDRFILSKGHSTPGYYSTLALRGFFPESELSTFDRIDSRLQAHPDMNKCPGVDYSTGSLGQGLSIGIGIAQGGAAAGRSFHTFVLIGDGESQEGQVWEAAMYAGASKVKRIVAIVDYNKVQLAATTAQTLDLEPLADKWTAFGWNVLECDGNDMAEVLQTISKAVAQDGEGPVVVLAHTVKGKGVSFMEGKFQWHGKAPDIDEYRRALHELGCSDALEAVND
ncbi:MAG: transketolase [Spirochaetales bacterium]|nr:transketolase [Spirochaetales bacterium]